jgi:glycosyltransferase involved in cell wall biosynthesis
MVGCILPWKGHRVFIEAAGRIIQREGLRNCAFWIVGGAAPGTEEFLASLNERSRELGLQIRFLGHQDNVYKWLSHADVVVHASVEPEPFGRVIIEAMALGKPVIATQIGGPLEIVVNGRNGILVPPNEPDTLADAVARVLSDDEMRTRLQQGGIETVENTFSTARFQHTLRGVYRQAVPQLAGVAR